MVNQQIKFALIFIILGAILGWYLHLAYYSSNNKMITGNKAKTSITLSPNIVKNKAEPLTILSDEDNKKHFAHLLKSSQYEDALLWYQNKGTKNNSLLFSVLLAELDKLARQSDQNVFVLLDFFLQDNYDNSKLLMIQADALVSNEQLESAIESFFLAKNYAQDNKAYNKISQKIHEFSFKIFKQFQTSKKWQRSIDVFKKLIENEPQFSFYHLALAESYININAGELALPHLQLITEDSDYGHQALEMLETIVFQSSSNGIALEEQGNHYIVNSFIADLYPVKLMLDTGASYSSLSSDTIAQLVSQQLAEKVGHNRVFTAGGEIEVDFYKIEKMSIGDFTLRDIVVAELDLNFSGENDNKFDGLLGVNFLNQFNFSIDHETKLLLLSPKNNMNNLD